MTTTDSIWAAAEHLLRRDAEELRESSTSPRDRDDWTGEEEAKADYDEHIAVADALASLSTEAAQPPAGWREALEFYAQGRHFGLSDESAWDTVSGEPQNFWCDEAGTATIEDGSIAKLALSGHAIRFEDEDTIAPSEQAPARAAPAAAAPEYPQMPEMWHVDAHVLGEKILSIGNNDWLSGKGELTEAEEQAVIGMAQTLLSFVGYGMPPSSFDPDADDGQAQRDQEVGRQWRLNSSLEKWFPLTAEKLERLQAAFAARVDASEREAFEAQFPAPEQRLDDIEQYRMQMAGICTASIGYWKAGDGVHPDYDTLALREVAKLYEKYDELFQRNAALTDWVVSRWHDEVANRPLTNRNRRPLDDTWRQVLRHLGVDDEARLGPRHDDLLAAAPKAVQQFGAGDAVFAFASMLTALPRVVPFGSAAWATPGVELATAFNAANGLSVSLDFPSGIVFPKVDGDLLAVIEKAAAPQPAAQQGDDATALNEIADIFQIGSEARKDRRCILETVSNSFRREQCLSRIEHSYFMVPRPPDEWEEDDEGGEECLLNWGDEPDEYTKRFGEALTQIAEPTPAAQGDALDAERYRLLRRGQRWSVIDGIGDTLRGDELDAAIDAARKEKS